MLREDYLLRGAAAESVFNFPNRSDSGHGLSVEERAFRGGGDFNPASEGPVVIFSSHDLAPWILAHPIRGRANKIFISRGYNG